MYTHSQPDMYLTACRYINVTAINWENARLNALEIDIAAV